MINRDEQIKIIDRIRLDVHDQTTELSEKYFQASEVLEFLKINGFNKITQRKLGTLCENYIIEPRKIGNNYLYSIDDLRELLVTLKTNEELSLTLNQRDSIRLFHKEAKFKALIKSSGNHHNQNDIKPEQTKRASMYWRSHLIMVLLEWIFKGKIPAIAVIIIREKSKNNKQIDDIQIKEIDRKAVQTGYSEDITLVTTEDKEVLHKDFNEDEWIVLKNDDYIWYQMECGSENYKNLIEMIVAVPLENHNRDSVVTKITNKKSKDLFFTILRGCFLKISSIQVENKIYWYTSTRLQTIAHFIPKLIDKWQYCSIFIPNEQGQLTIIASNHDKSKISNVLNSERLLEWSYHNNQCVFIPETQDGDIRIVDEKIKSCAISPTRIGDKHNGLIYITANRSFTDNVVETELEESLLNVLSRVVGELIELEQMRLTTRQAAMKIINKPSIENTHDFKTALLEIIRKRLVGNLRFKDNENLQIMCIKVSDYEKVKDHSEILCTWLLNQIHRNAYNFYINNDLLYPELFFPNDKKDEFIILLDSSFLDSEKEIELREDLRKHLNSMNLSRGTTDLNFKCYLWSMPFRYSNLEGKLSQYSSEDPTDALASELVKSATNSFKILHLVHLAHEAEKNGNYDRMLDLFKQADILDPDNLYIQRHIAKAYSHKNEYADSEKIWREIIENDDHISHNRQLVFNLICQNKFDDALIICEKKLNNPEKPCSDAEFHFLYGYILHKKGRFQEAKNQYGFARKFNKDHASFYLLRTSEVNISDKQFNDAINNCSIAKTKSPRDPNVSFSQMEISLKINEFMANEEKQL